MIEAVFFYSWNGARRGVTITLAADSLQFEGSETPLHTWPYEELEAIARPQSGQAFGVTHKGQPGARLVFGDGSLMAALRARAPQLRRRLSDRSFGRGSAWAAGLVAAIFVAGYMVLQLVPQRIAFILPDSWRERVGAQVEAALSQGARQCSGAAGMQALAAIMAKIAEGQPGLPPVSIRVYDVSVTNAFAMPGERILITYQLIRQARRPEQVAGVLAHELGHVAFRHSETQLVRATGLQILLGMLSGGDTASSITSVAAILSYSREAEVEADDYAITSMISAAIDPMGLKEFFEQVLKEDSNSSTGTFGKIRSLLGTHPGTEDRIHKIHPLPVDVVARPVLTDAQWKALKGICG